MKIFLIVLVSVLALVGIGGCTVAGINNDIVRKDEAVSAAWSQVENVLQRRYDLIPNLVNTVKGFAKQEQTVLTEVTRLRSQWGAATTPGDKAAASGQLEGALGRLMVISERYPELKSGPNFLELQAQLEGTENRIAVERRNYIASVESYNATIRSFPNSLVANFGGFTQGHVFQGRRPGREGSDRAVLISGASRIRSRKTKPRRNGGVLCSQ